MEGVLLTTFSCEGISTYAMASAVSKSCSPLSLHHAGVLC
jgi:hypothetical protein